MVDNPQRPSKSVRSRAKLWTPILHVVLALSRYRLGYPDPLFLDYAVAREFVDPFFTTALFDHVWNEWHSFPRFPIGRNVLSWIWWESIAPSWRDRFGLLVFFDSGFREDFVDQTVFFGFDGGEEVISFGVGCDLIGRFAGVFGQNIVELAAEPKDFTSLDLDIGDLSANTSVRLVNHDRAVGQAVPFASSSSGEEYRRSAGGFTDAIGCYRATEHLHGVVDRQSRPDFATGGVDIKVDVLAAVFALQVQQFHDDFVGVAGIDFSLEKHNSIFQQQIAQCHLTLALVTLMRMGVKNRRHAIIPIHCRFLSRMVCAGIHVSFALATVWQGYIRGDQGASLGKSIDEHARISHLLAGHR